MEENKPTPIKCDSCDKDSGHTVESVQYERIPSEGLKCKNCGKVFLKLPH